MVGIKSKLGEKGQITIPKALRDYFHLSAGDVVELDSEQEHIIVKKVPKKDPAAMILAFQKKYGKILTKERISTIDWKKEYTSEIEHRHGS